MVQSLAETDVSAHTALVAQVEKDLTANFDKEFSEEREKIKALDNLAEEVKLELDRVQTKIGGT